MATVCIDNSWAVLKILIGISPLLATRILFVVELISKEFLLILLISPLSGTRTGSNDMIDRQFFLKSLLIEYNCYSNWLKTSVISKNNINQIESSIAKRGYVSKGWWDSSETVRIAKATGIQQVVGSIEKCVLEERIE